MVYRQGEHSVETRESMRGGKGSVQITNLEKALLPQNCRLFGVLRLAPAAPSANIRTRVRRKCFTLCRGKAS